MSQWNNRSNRNRTRELLGELVRMWQCAGIGRANAIGTASTDLGLSARKGKCVLYDEPHTLSDLEAHGAESRAGIAWLKLADKFREHAEYCEAQAQLSRIKKWQGELDLGASQVQCKRSSGPLLLKRAA